MVLSCGGTEVSSRGSVRRGGHVDQRIDTYYCGEQGPRAPLPESILRLSLPSTMPITMHPGNPLSLHQLAVLVAVLYLVASAVLMLKWWMR